MKKVLFLILIATFFSCVHENSKPKKASEDNELIVLDIDSYPDNNKLNYSNFFSSRKIVPLETNSDCYIGQIDQIYVANDMIFVLDSYYSKSVFVFTTNGEFIRKIGNLGRGPGEFKAPSVFKVNEQNKEIYIFDRNYQVIHKYDFNGEYLSDIKITGDWVHDFIINNQNQLYVNTEIARDGNNKHLLRELNLKGEEVKKWFPTPEYGKGWSFNLSTQSFSPTQKDIKFHEPYLDTIYSISSDGVKPFMCLSSVDLITNKDIQDYKSKEKNGGVSLGLLDIKKISGPMQYYENNILIFIVVRNKFSSYFILFNKQNNNSTASEFYNFDDDLAFAPYASPPFVGVNQTEFIKAIKPMEIADFKKRLFENENQLSEDLKIKLENTTEQSNPILIFYETKKEW